jgi:hypothetical protein
LGSAPQPNAKEEDDVTTEPAGRTQDALEMGATIDGVLDAGAQAETEGIRRPK